MARIIRQIIDWMAERPYWEQACFDKIIKNEYFDDAILDELLTYLLQDGGLLPMTEDRPRPSFLQEPLDEGEESSGRCVLIKELSNLQNINALAENQRLTFHPQLTMIFGSNGSGKSGYARVLGNASFTRGDEDVLPNINMLDRESYNQTADFLIEFNGKEKEFTHRIGSRNRFLDSFYMFDTTSVKAHLSSENKMSFSPAGLDLLSKLVDATDSVRDRLDSEIEIRRQHNLFTNSLTGESSIKEWLRNINADTQIIELNRQAVWTEDDQNKYDSLEIKIAKLISENMQEKIEILEEKIYDLRSLIRDLADLEDALNQESQTKLLLLIIESNKYRSQLEYFSDPEKLDDWKKFAEAAKEYAATFDGYPSEEEICLLCAQHLTKDAVDHIMALWKTLEKNAFQCFNSISEDITTQVLKMKSYKIDLLDERKVAYRHLREDGQSCLSMLHTYLDSCGEIRESMIDHLKRKKIYEPKCLPKNVIYLIDELLSKYQDEIQIMKDRHVDEEISKLSEEKTILDHQHYIHEYKAVIAEFIKTCQWIGRAEDRVVRGNSNSITRKYGELFRELVTDEYIRLFAETLEELCCPLNVRIVTRNRKGNTFRQVSLSLERDDDGDLPAPNKVLSEGEQRAVALADFFTEVALDTNSRGVILDDPITSLDFSWQETVANYIVQEAKRQQVIVFTHDLHFMYCLTKIADDEVEFETHYIQKRQNTPGYVFLNNSPGVEGNYKNALIPEEIWNEARGIEVPPVQVERLLKEGFGALRSCYEYLIIYKIFANVVQRFGARISVERMKNVCIDPQIHQEIIDKVGLLSRYIEGHLQSDIHIAQKPTPDMLKKEIDDYQEICSEIKASIKSKR